MPRLSLSPAQQRATFDLGNAASGVYYYRMLEDGQLVQSGKLTLIR